MIDWICGGHSLRNTLIALVLCVLLFPISRARADGACSNNFFDNGIISANGSVAIVASNNMVAGGNLNYFWQKTGTRTWHRELVAGANGGSCPGNCTGWCSPVPWGYLSNAIAWTGNSVIIAAKDQRDGGIYFWWQAADTTPWHQETVASGPSGCCAFGSIINGVVTKENLGYTIPSLAWTGRSAVVAACDEAGDLHYWYENKGQTRWFHQLVAKGGCSYQPSIAWTGTSVVIAANCRQGSTLCYYWQQAGSGTWNPQVVDTGSYFPSIAWTGEDVIVAGEQPSDAGYSILYWWQTKGTATWHKEQIYGPSTSDFGSPTTAAAHGSVVIATGEDNLEANRLDYWWRPDTANSKWTLQNPSGSSDYNAWTNQRSIAWTGLSMIISSTTPCGDLDYWWQPGGSVTWHQQRVVTNTGWPPGTC